MANIVEVCNMALDNLGQTVGIASLSEASKAARACSRHLQQALDELMSVHPWPFCTKSAALALTEDTPIPGWTYQYAYPSDCVRAWVVCDENGVRLALQSWPDTYFDSMYYNKGVMPGLTFVPFQVVSGSQQTCIITDLQGAMLIYSKRQTDVSRLPPLVVNALAWHLANKIAMPITADPKMQQSAMNMANIALVTAQAAQASQSQPDPEPSPPSIAARQ